jgi:hypothetical protein
MLALLLWYFRGSVSGRNRKREPLLIEAPFGRVRHRQPLTHAPTCDKKLSYFFRYFRPGYERPSREESMLFMFAEVICATVKFIRTSCKCDHNSGDGPIARPVELRWPVSTLPIEITNPNWTKAVHLQVVNPKDLRNFERWGWRDVDGPSRICRAALDPCRAMMKVTVDLDCANDDSQQYGRNTDR